MSKYEKCITWLQITKEDLTIDLLFSSLNGWNETLPAATVFSIDMSWGLFTIFPMQGILTEVIKVLFEGKYEISYDKFLVWKE